MELTLIYARASNGAIGFEERLPWHLPADLKRFKALTMGKPMIMGRKTFESLPGLLPGRRHIVLSRREHWNKDGAEIAHTVDQALALARTDNDTGEICVVGGSAIYDVFRPLAHRIEVTEIDADYPGDTFMKPLGSEWVVKERKEFVANGETPAYAFVTYRRAPEHEARGIA
ncbi:dihydrofolate reductase [Erythrobacter sp. KMU-140]|uniref:Dihydrofolate reductase n=1 Tax=Erythrobacter rubeus TaxID=2760803 RepID=A0ABR8KRA0_9SPHN|nr:dihydrofolate reductase [Erythrobacter rubeus]